MIPQTSDCQSDCPCHLANHHHLSVKEEVIKSYYDCLSPSRDALPLRDSPSSHSPMWNLLPHLHENNHSYKYPVLQHTPLSLCKDIIVHTVHSPHVQCVTVPALHILPYLLTSFGCSFRWALLICRSISLFLTLSQTIVSLLSQLNREMGVWELRGGRGGLWG